MQLQMSCNKARLRYSRPMDARSPDLTRDAAGWRNDAPATKSLAEVNASVALPIAGVWWRRLLAFVGPGYLVSVGYMDPGNWATDLAGRAGCAARTRSALSLPVRVPSCSLVRRLLSLYCGLELPVHVRPCHIPKT